MFWQAVTKGTKMFVIQPYPARRRPKVRYQTSSTLLPILVKRGESTILKNSIIEYKLVQFLVQI
jgi:hypothetical protein